MASTPVGSNAIILDVLDRSNYKSWRSRVKTYLLAEDLWEVVEAIKKPAKLEDDEAEYKAWTKKNAKALYVIQNSCGQEMFSFIEELETAKSVWEALEQECKVVQAYDVNNGDHLQRYTSFIKFLSSGDWDKAKECLGEVDVRSVARAIDPTNDLGDIALHVAARQGHLHIVQELVVLITTQEDLKTKNADGYTALHTATIYGHVKIVKELGPWMRDVKDDFGRTALHIAVNEEQLDIVKELVMLMNQEDLAIKNDEGYTALHLAVNNGNVPIVKQLMTKEEGEYDFNPYVPFTTSVNEGDWDKAKECLRQLDNPYDVITRVDPRDGYGNTALHVAAIKGFAQIVKELVSLLKLRQEEDLELKTAHDFTTFGSSVSLGVSEVVLMERAKYMIGQYDKMLTNILEVQSAEGCTALHLAVTKGNVDIVKELVPLMRRESLEIKDVSGYTALHRAAADEQQRIDIVKILVSHMRKEDMEVKSVGEGYNALHIAVLFGNMNIVKELVSLMRPEAMEEKDNNGNTALAWALKVGKYEDVIAMAKYMAENNNKVFGISPPLSWIPVAWACINSNWNLCRYLYSLTPLEFLEPEHGPDGAQIIITCFRAMKLDMALHLLQRCPRLAINPTRPKCSPIMELAGAGVHSAFLSGTQLGFWQKLIYNRMQKEPINWDNHHTCINISSQEDDRHNQMDLTCSVICLYRQLVNGVLNLLGVNRLRELKWIHTRSIDILCCISKMVKEDNLTSAQLDIVKMSIFKAVEHGNVEFVTHMCQAHPGFIESYDENNRNIFQFAIECRQNKIYSLMHGLDKEDQSHIGIYVTTFPENILHLAGSLSPLSRFNRIRGAALQMQRELQWFKEVKNIVPLEMHEVSNSFGMTPHELFTKNHEKLKVEAENSMKATATSCTVVGALIVTIMFAAAFTIPGGNNGSTGTPIFLTQKLFLVFIISDTLSLVFSTTSVMLFLGIFTSRYAEDDFLKDLPTKMMIGLFTLFLSIVTMMIAFSSALNIMLAEKYSWAVIPSIFVACIPVASFMWLQFPLLSEMFWSTYGPGIFDKKVKRWVKL